MTKLSKTERENAVALVKSGLGAKTVAAIYGVSTQRIYQIVKAAPPEPLPAAPAPLPPASRRAPETAPPARLPLAQVPRCGTVGCRGARQPGRDFCATCLAEALRPNRRAHMI